MAAPEDGSTARYRTLDPERIIATAIRLQERITERFPDSSLRGVAAELVQLARDLAVGAQKLEAPIWWLRFLIGGVFLAGAAVFLFVGTVLPFERIYGGEDVVESVQGIEASLNTIILAGLGLLTLVRTEERLKRKRVFEQLHGLRSMIHVIDMHQLTKDPAALSDRVTPVEPSEQLPPSEQQPAILSTTDLARYLDYCSEMLSITGKLAALFAQSLNDEVVIEAVNDLEELGTNLSRKIWQKITLLLPVETGKPVKR